MLFNISEITDGKTRSICPENFTGEKGKAGMSVDGPAWNCARDLGQGWKVSPFVMIAPHTEFTLADIRDMGIIRHIWMTPAGLPGRFVILRMYWDDSEIPSVECPLGDFFCNAYVPEYAQLSSAMVCVNPRNGLNCYWDMPFRKHARITVENIGESDFRLYYQIDYELCRVPDQSGYFHAQFRRTNPLPYKENYLILDGVQGKGQYVGTYLAWGVHNTGWWGEGEIKFYMDGDQQFPTICGTGTEDYFCGAYNFDNNHQYERFGTMYSGMIPFAPDGLYKSQQRFSLYRWHLNDPIRFEKDLKVTIQALGWRSEDRYLPLQDDIASVAFWYQDQPTAYQPKLPEKDELEII